MADYMGARITEFVPFHDIFPGTVPAGFWYRTSNDIQAVPVLHNTSTASRGLLFGEKDGDPLLCFPSLFVFCVSAILSHYPGCRPGGDSFGILGVGVPGDI